MAQVAWAGKAANYDAGQAALLERAKMNSEASQGQYKASEGAANNASLHVAGGNKY